MTGAVPERLAEPMPREHVRRAAPSISTAPRTRPHRADRGCVRRPDRLEQTAKPGGDRPDMQRPRKVHAVSVVDAPEVQHHPVARPPAPGRSAGRAAARCWDPDATIVSNAGRSKPAARIAASTPRRPVAPCGRRRPARGSPRRHGRQPPRRLAEDRDLGRVLHARGPARSIRSVATSTGTAPLLKTSRPASSRQPVEPRDAQMRSFDPDRRAAAARTTVAMVSSSVRSAYVDRRVRQLAAAAAAVEIPAVDDERAARRQGGNDDEAAGRRAARSGSEC